MVEYMDQCMGELFEQGQSTVVIMEMTYSEMKYWSEWIDLIKAARNNG